jgi:hypothetical protein
MHQNTPDTIPAPPSVPAPRWRLDLARRDAAVLAIHTARSRVDELTVEFARHAGIDTNARRLVRVLSCLGPILTALEHLVPEVAS